MKTRSRSSIALCATAILLSGLSLGVQAQDEQDPVPPVPPPLPPSEGAQPQEDPWADAPRGVLPEGVGELARERFARLLRGTAIQRAGQTLAPDSADAMAGIHSFWMDFEIRARLDSHNQINARCEFLRPNHCRFSTSTDTSTSWRGPDGYWIQSDDAPAERLAGDQFAPDRDFLDELVAISNNMLALFEPRELRVLGLEALDAPPASLPPPYQPGGRLPRDGALASELEWIAITTPDCVVLETSRARGTTSAQQPGRLYRLTIGLDHESGRPLLARIEELVDEQPRLRNAVFVALRNYLPMHSGPEGLTRNVPFKLDVFAIDPERAEPSFERRPRWELGVKGGELDPAGLTEASFGAPR